MIHTYIMKSLGFTVKGSVWEYYKRLIDYVADLHVLQNRQSHKSFNFEFSLFSIALQFWFLSHIMQSLAAILQCLQCHCNITGTLRHVDAIPLESVLYESFDDFTIYLLEDLLSINLFYISSILHIFCLQRDIFFVSSVAHSNSTGHITHVFGWRVLTAKSSLVITISIA